MNIEIIGVPLYYGCDNPGTQQAYQIFCREGLVARIEGQGHKVVSCQEVEVPPVMEKQADPTMEYLQEVQITCKNLEQAVAAAKDRGNFPLIIGGDHALGIGSVAGLSHTVPKEDLTVIWVDAHTDINTNETSASHHIHGMPLAACLGLGSPKLIEGFGRGGAKLLPQNLFYIGSRSVDPGEEEIVTAHNIRCFAMEELREKGMEQCVKELLSLVKTKYIHISFDVDFMDGGEYFATGLPIPNGPSVAQTHQCLKLLMADRRVGSMDFVEYSPKNDGDRRGLAVCMDLLESSLGALRV